MEVVVETLRLSNTAKDKRRQKPRTKSLRISPLGKCEKKSMRSENWKTEETVLCRGWSESMEDGVMKLESTDKHEKNLFYLVNKKPGL